jgi:hypothetical protein
MKVHFDANGKSFIGEQVVKCVEVDDSVFTENNRLKLKFEIKDGRVLNMFLFFTKKDGTDNKFTKYLFQEICEGLLNTKGVTDIDTDDLVGKFIRVNVVYRDRFHDIDTDPKTRLFEPDTGWLEDTLF